MTGGTYTTAPSYRVVFSAGTVTVVPTVGGTMGCGSGVTVAPTFTLSGGSPVGGTQATVTPTLGTYIASVPVLSGGSGFISLPTLAVTDSEGTGAVLVAVMSGVSPGDVLSYTASWGWMTTAIGGAVSSPQPGSLTPASITNFSGQIEGPVGLLAGFPTKKTLKFGVNAESEPTSYESPGSLFANYAQRITGPANGHGWQISGATIPESMYTVDGIPTGWYPTYAADSTLSAIFYTPNATNPFDAKLSPSLVGTWTIVYDDPNVKTGNAAILGLTSLSSATITGPTTTILGTTVTMAYTVAADSAISWDIKLSVTYSQPGGEWTISNLWIIPPNNPISRANPLAIDANYRALVTSSKGAVPAVIRTMDACAYDAGYSNYIDASDLLAVSSFSWGGADPRASTWRPGSAGQPAAIGHDHLERLPALQHEPGRRDLCLVVAEHLFRGVGIDGHGRLRPLPDAARDRQRPVPGRRGHPGPGLCRDRAGHDPGRRPRAQERAVHRDRVGQRLPARSRLPAPRPWPRSRGSSSRCG